MTTKVNPEPRIAGETHLGEIPLWYFRRSTVTLTLFLLVFVLFLAMVHEMLVAGLLGAIIGAYLRPIHVWLARRTSSPTFAALTTLTVVIVPAIGIMLYGFLEVRKAAKYLVEHVDQVVDKIQEALERVPFVGSIDAEATLTPALTKLAGLATEVPEGIQSILSEFAIDTSIFLFTAFYVLTQAEVIVAFLRGKVPRRYGAFAESLESHVQGVLYGAIYSTLITQTLKAVLVLVLNLAFGVPLPVVLALVAFVIGFFPIVGSWTVFVPAAGYLLIFESSPWEALAMLVLGFGISTIFLSMMLRPKLAADRSQVLNFYWMFVALVAGVYTFGIPGIVVGPVVVGLLKAIFDTITAELQWAKAEGDGPEAKVFKEEEVGTGAPPKKQAGSEDDDEEP